MSSKNVPNFCCLPFSSVPIVFTNDTFMCARRWSGNGDPDAIQSCNTCEKRISNNDDATCIGSSYDGPFDIPQGEDHRFMWPFQFTGSLIVKDGCTFYGFQGENYEGQVSEFPAGLYPDIQTPYWWECGGEICNQPPAPIPDCTGCGGFFGSSKCRCLQEFIECEPRDGNYYLRF